MHVDAEANPLAATSYDGELPTIDGSDPLWPGHFMTVDLGKPDAPAPTGIFVRTTPGPAGAPRMVYVHGLGGSSTNWTDLSKGLSGHVAGTAIDLPGYGRSDPAPYGDYSIGAQARYVAAVIEAGGPDPVHLVGNSMGGLISVVLAATRPELVRTLTLVSPAMPFYSPAKDSDPRMLLMAVPGLGQLIERRMATIDPMQRVEAVAEMCFGDPSLIPQNRLDEQVQELQERAGLPWANDAFIGSLRGLMSSYARPGKSSPWRLAAGIDVPTLIVWGDRDRLVSVDLAPKLAETIPGSRLLILPGVGHTAQMEAPELTARAMLPMLEQAYPAG